MHRMHFGQHQASSAIYMYNNTCTCTCIVHVLSCSYTYMYMYTYMCACTYMYMYDQSLRQRQSKATMPKNKLPQVGQTFNLPTEPPRQLSWASPIFKGKGVSSLINRVTHSVLHMYMYTVSFRFLRWRGFP